MPRQSAMPTLMMPALLFGRHRLSGTLWRMPLWCEPERGRRAVHVTSQADTHWPQFAVRIVWRLRYRGNRVPQRGDQRVAHGHCGAEEEAAHTTLPALRDVNSAAPLMMRRLSRPSRHRICVTAPRRGDGPCGRDPVFVRGCQGVTGHSHDGPER